LSSIGELILVLLFLVVPIVKNFFIHGSGKGAEGDNILVFGAAFSFFVRERLMGPGSGSSLSGVWPLLTRGLLRLVNWKV
jgi:hypothetical protein